MKTLTVALLMFATTFAFADVQVIQAKINGSAYKTLPNIVNVVAPKISLDKSSDSELNCDANTASVACKMLGFEYVSAACAGASTGASVSLGETGLNMGAFTTVLSVLSCKGSSSY